MNIYAMNDCDWVAAKTSKEAVNFYKEWTGCDEEEFENDPEPLSEDDLNRLIFRDDFFDDESPNKTRTFKEELWNRLSREGEEFPQLFASTEF